MQKLDPKSSILFSVPLDGLVSKKKPTRVSIRLPARCDTSLALRRLLESESEMRVTVIDQDVHRYDARDHEVDRVTAVVAMYDDERRNYVPGLTKELDSERVTERKLSFRLNIRNRPGIFESKKRLLR